MLYWGYKRPNFQYTIKTDVMIVITGFTGFYEVNNIFEVKEKPIAFRKGNK
jgi:hypothetical protein